MTASEPAPRRRAREAKRATYRRLVLAAAERVFAAHGYAGAKMAAIAGEAGLALGTVYTICGGKDELYGAVHAEHGAAMLAKAAEEAQEARSPREALRAGVHAYVGYLLDHPTYLEIHLQESQPWALAPRFVTEVQRAQWAEGLALTTAVLRAGIDDGSFVDDDPERLARMMIAAHQVCLVDWVQRGQEEPVGEVVGRLLEIAERLVGR